MTECAIFSQRLKIFLNHSGLYHTCIYILNCNLHKICDIQHKFDIFQPFKSLNVVIFTSSKFCKGISFYFGKAGHLRHYSTYFTFKISGTDLSLLVLPSPFYLMKEVPSIAQCEQIFVN